MSTKTKTKTKTGMRTVRFTKENSGELSPSSGQEDNDIIMSQTSDNIEIVTAAVCVSVSFIIFCIILFFVLCVFFYIYYKNHVFGFL